DRRRHRPAAHPHRGEWRILPRDGQGASRTRSAPRVLPERNQHLHRRGCSSRLRHPLIPSCSSDDSRGLHAAETRHLRIHVWDGDGPREAGGGIMTTATAPAEQCTIPVSGMSCAGCSSKVQRSLETTSGVRGANVNLMTGTATVTYDPAVTSPEQLVEVIRATGYGAEVPAADQSEEDLFDANEAERIAEMAELGRKLLVSAIAAAIVMTTGMRPGNHAVGATSRWLQLAVTLPVVFWAGRHFYTRAWNAFRHHSADMNTLIAVGTGAAFVYSVVVTGAAGWFASHGIEPHVYFEAVVVIIALILLGNLLEARARSRTSAAVRKLAGLRPAAARVVRGGEEREIPLDGLQVGDEALVRPGERIPADGTVIDGASN